MASSSRTEVVWGRQDDYEIIRKLGKGKYAEVFQGMSVMSGEYVVVKVLNPVRVQKIQREVEILKCLEGNKGIPRLVDIIRDSVSQIPSLVLEYSANENFRELYPKLTDFHIRFYMYELLKILQYTHSKGVMHRDVKPNNLMIDHAHRTLKLIDWGLAEFYSPGTPYNVRVASRYFKGPELLVNNQLYDYSLDMWSAGALLAGLIFKKEPFFHGTDNVDQLVKISKVLGTQELSEYLAKYKLGVPHELEDMLGYFPKKIWTKFITNDNRVAAAPEALDLLSNLLRYDHSERLLPSEAIEHDYFLPVRQMWSCISNRNLTELTHPEALETARILSRTPFK